MANLPRNEKLTKVTWNNSQVRVEWKIFSLMTETGLGASKL